MDNVIQLFPKKVNKDPWEKAQPSLRSMGDREELWSHPYFGISNMIWATGSNNTPDPPTPSGGSPVANVQPKYQMLKVA